MNTLTRKNAFILVEKMRDILIKELDFVKYMEGDTSSIDIELNEVELQGVSNGFLAEIINTIFGYKVEIVGEVEELFTCPCCGFKTLTELYDINKGTGYDICPYCQWEDDGTEDINSIRSINNGSIKDYREKIHSNYNYYYIDKWLKD
jgi:hypothetical protein